MIRELLLGCGNDRNKKIYMDQDSIQWKNLTTVDLDPYCGANVVHDLNVTPWPFEDDSFDEIHAYEVLEHLGRQGDVNAFFSQFSEIYRILKPGGLLIGTTPSFNSRWIWGDPGHTRYFGPECLVFLSQPEYTKQVGRSQMTDYRHLFTGDFQVIGATEDDDDFQFVIEAVKPSRIDTKFK